MEENNVKTRILVVDDTIEILQIFSLVLRSHGYEVFEASNGTQALKIITENTPDLVVLDVVLPDISGIDICRRIKTDPHLKDIFVVLVSGHAMSVNQKVDGLAIGADDYLTKPLALSEFVARIRTMIRLQQTNAALRASEEHYRRLVDILPDAVQLVDLKGHVISVNARALAMLGYQKSSELKGKRAFQFVRRKDWQALNKGMRAIQTGDVMWNTECMAVKKDGIQVPVDINATLLTDIKGVTSGVLLVARDLTLRNQAREAIERSQRLFKAILDNISDAAWLQQADGRYLACNEALARFYGTTPDKIIGKTPADLSPKNAQTISKEDFEMIRLGKQTVTENFFHDAAGTPMWFEIVRSPVFGESGEVASLVGIAHDVTERRWFEGLLQVQRDFGVFLSSTDDMKTALESLLDISMKYEGIECGGVYLVDPKTGALTLDVQRNLKPEFYRNVLRMPSVNGVRNDAVDWMSVIKKMRGGPKASISLPILHGDKAVAFLNLGSRKEIPNRSKLAIETIAAQAGDAIARIRVEETLQENRQLLEKTLHSIRSAVFVVSAKTDRILECNPGASDLFGYTRQELLGARTAILHVNNAMWKHFRHRVRNELKESGAVNDFELQMKRKNGTIFPAEQSIAFTVDDTGHKINSVMMVRDIGARKRYEDELLLLPNQIIEAQESERKRVARELHDGVNQIIAAAKLRLKRVEDDIVNVNPAAKEMLSRCYNLMVQALEENRRIAHNLRPSDLDDLGFPTACRNFCEQVRTRSNLAFTYDFSGYHRRFLPDVELHLFRILQESVTNVEKHARAKNVHIQMTVKGENLILSVKDDGCGFKMSQANDPREQWSGMGLTNMKERASAIGGTFDATSSSGNGSTIIVTAPLKFRGEKV